MSTQNDLKDPIIARLELIALHLKRNNLLGQLQSLPSFSSLTFAAQLSHPHSLPLKLKIGTRMDDSCQEVWVLLQIPIKGTVCWYYANNIHGFTPALRCDIGEGVIESLAKADLTKVSLVKPFCWLLKEITRENVRHWHALTKWFFFMNGTITAETVRDGFEERLAQALGAVEKAKTTPLIRLYSAENT
ncbi:hypothetical protein BDV96DRAFT_677350 [Lophiotrema nucula]|uniref:Uncharacterized protein n=1 Tax=Lophiotrema nucula TaxID=690887 RepID=A0A6A5YF69_9PLEO|nr:hypothetical protein BDV96DRAFT_677350 [Lophiotrema nucula]